MLYSNKKESATRSLKLALSHLTLKIFIRLSHHFGKTGFAFALRKPDGNAQVVRCKLLNNFINTQIMYANDVQNERQQSNSNPDSIIEFEPALEKAKGQRGEPAAVLHG